MNHPRRLHACSGVDLPTSGDVRLYNRKIKTSKDVKMAREKLQIGVCPGESFVWPRLTVQEHMRVFGMIQGVVGDDLNTRVTEACYEVNQLVAC